MEAAENNDAAVDDQPRPEVADAILAAPTTTTGREPPGPDSADGGEQGGERSGAGDGIAVRNPRSTDRTLPSGDIPLDSIRVDFTTGNFRFTTEGTLDITFLGEGTSGASGDQSSTTNTVAEGQVEVGTSTLPERVPDGTFVTLNMRSE